MGFSRSCCQAATGDRTVLKLFHSQKLAQPPASEESLAGGGGGGLIPGPPWRPPPAGLCRWPPHSSLGAARRLTRWLKTFSRFSKRSRSPPSTKPTTLFISVVSVTCGLKILPGIFRNKKFTSFKLCTILSGVMNPHTTPPRPCLDVNCSSIQHVRTVYAPYCLVTSWPSRLWNPLSWYHRA